MSKYKKCPIHKSYKCGCKLKNEEKYINMIIKNYIQMYKRCLILFTFNNGKIKFNNIERKFNTGSIPHI